MLPEEGDTATPELLPVAVAAAPDDGVPVSAGDPPPVVVATPARLHTEET
jgi:hypothetical protein